MARMPGYNRLYPGINRGKITLNKIIENCYHEIKIIQNKTKHILYSFNFSLKLCTKKLSSQISKPKLGQLISRLCPCILVMCSMYWQIPDGFNPSCNQIVPK